MSEVSENYHSDYSEQTLDDTNCPVCTEYFTDPRLLPCLHTVCRGCLDRTYGVGSYKKKLSCPVCSELFDVSTTGMDGLPKNVLAQRRVKNETGGNDASPICLNCNDHSPAETWCKQCIQFLCSECTNAHRRVPTVKLHILENVEDLQDKEEERLLKYTKMDVCRKHKKDKKKFCNRCKIAICAQCARAGHARDRGHDVVNLTTAHTFYRERVEKLYKAIERKLESLKKYEHQLEGGKRTLEQDQNSAQRSLERVFDHLSRTLHLQRKRMETKLEVAHNMKEEDLDGKLTGIENSVAKLEKANELSVETLKNRNDPEVVGMMGQVAARMNSLVQEKLETEAPKNRQEPSLQFVTDKAKLNHFNDLIATIGDVKTTAYIPPTIITPSDVICGQKTTVGMVSFGGDQKLDKQDVHAFRIDLRDPDDIIVQCTPRSTRNGTYECIFRPQIPGDHKLSVKLAGRHIYASPLTVSVDDNEPESGSDINAESPIGVAVDAEDGTIYVTDPDKKRLIVVDFNFSNEKEIKLDFAPFDIAIDRERNLVMSDQDAKCIRITNKEGEEINVIKSDQLKQPRGLAVDNYNNIVVADSEAACVFVFDHDGQLQMKIDGTADSIYTKHPVHQLKKPVFVAVDRHANIYVSDTASNRVVVYSRSGYLLNTIATSGHGRGKLDKPVGVARDRSGHVLVCDASNRVMVYTMEGAFVSRIGSPENALRDPHGIATLGDGRFVIADTGNRSMKIYRYL